MMKNQPINRITDLQNYIYCCINSCSLFFAISVLRLLKDGADPHTVVYSGGSLLHLVRVIED